MIRFTDANKPLETIYISNKQFEDILRKLLLVKQYRVEIWKKTQKASNEWTLGYHVSSSRSFHWINKDHSFRYSVFIKVITKETL
jgi:hypothetical protein